MPPEMAEKKVKRAHRAYTEGDIDELELAVSRGGPNSSIRLLSPAGARPFFAPHAAAGVLKRRGAAEERRGGGEIEGNKACGAKEDPRDHENLRGPRLGSAHCADADQKSPG